MEPPTKTGEYNSGASAVPNWDITMQLKDLVKPIDEMTVEELHEHLRNVRHRRSVERPASKAIVERAEKKASRGRVSTVDKLLDGLSDEDKARLIEQLTRGDNGEGSGGTEAG